MKYEYHYKFICDCDNIGTQTVESEGLLGIVDDSVNRERRIIAARMAACRALAFSYRSNWTYDALLDKYFERIHMDRQHGIMYMNEFVMFYPEKLLPDLPNDSIDAFSYVTVEFWRIPVRESEPIDLIDFADCMQSVEDRKNDKLSLTGDNGNA